MEHVKQMIDDLHQLNVRRDASSSINGYFYQFELTLLHILYDGRNHDAFNDLECTAFYKVESIEDYVKFFEKDGIGYIRLAQIKHHSTSTNNSKYYGAVLSLYLTFLRFTDRKNTKINFLSTIFHFDLSKAKDVSIVLEEALLSKNKKLKSTIDAIQQTGFDTEENRKAFASKTKFIKTDSQSDITAKLKKELEHRYQSLQPSHTPEHLYASAISKLIQESREESTVSLSDLDAYFSGEVETLRNFYEMKIIDFVMELIDMSVTEIQCHFLYQAEVKESYTFIFQDLIAPFLKNKFQEKNYRKSFLHTVTPKDFFSAPELDTVFEFNAFLQASDAIKKKLAHLAKIIFAYMNEGNEVSLENWFKINEKGWLFTHPLEERGTGILIGQYSDDIYSLMNSIISRMKDKDLRPDVWYLHHLDEITSSRHLTYEVDFTSPQLDGSHYFCQPDDDHFHIQCMGCLSTRNFSQFQKVHNIFKDQCSERGEF